MTIAKRLNDWRKGKASQSAFMKRWQAYFRSPEWGVKRRQVIFRDATCVICNEDDPAKFDIHHRTYKRRFKEELTDLTTLCRLCHTEVTEMLKARGWKGR